MSITITPAVIRNLAGHIASETLFSAGLLQMNGFKQIPQIYDREPFFTATRLSLTEEQIRLSFDDISKLLMPQLNDIKVAINDSLTKLYNQYAKDISLLNALMLGCTYKMYIPDKDGKYGYIIKLPVYFTLSPNLKDQSGYVIPTDEHFFLYDFSVLGECCILDPDFETFRFELPKE